MLHQIIAIVKKKLRRLKYGQPLTLEQIQKHLDSISAKESEKRDLERIKRYFSDKEWENEKGKE